MGLRPFYTDLCRRLLQLRAIRCSGSLQTQESRSFDDSWVLVTSGRRQFLPNSDMILKLLDWFIGSVIPLRMSSRWSVSCCSPIWTSSVLAATHKKRARKETTLKELKVYAELFVEAKSAEIKSWFDNDVFDLVDLHVPVRGGLC